MELLCEIKRMCCAEGEADPVNSYDIRLKS